jgi:hypothetical protein
MFPDKDCLAILASAHLTKVVNVSMFFVGAPLGGNSIFTSSWQDDMKMILIPTEGTYNLRYEPSDFGPIFHKYPYFYGFDRGTGKRKIHIGFDWSRTEIWKSKYLTPRPGGDDNNC